MIGQAHKAGMRRPTHRIKPILDPDYPFYLTNLKDLRHSVLPLSALRDAFTKCFAHIYGLKAYWLAKMPIKDDGKVKRHFEQEKHLGAMSLYTFKVEGWEDDDPPPSTCSPECSWTTTITMASRWSLTLLGASPLRVASPTSGRAFLRQ